MAVVTLLHTVLAVKAGFGVEVVGEVILEASTDVGQGQVLTLATVMDIGQALMADAGRDKGADQGLGQKNDKPHPTKLDCLHLGVATLVSSSDIEVLTIGQCHLDIVGQEAAERAAIDVIDFNVAVAIGEGAFDESFNLGPTLTWGEAIHGRKGEHGSDCGAYGVSQFHLHNLSNTRHKFNSNCRR